MPKPPLKEEDAILEDQIIQTMIAGLHQWRSDLDMPESYSDMQACVRGLMKMFEIKRKPLVTPLRLKCDACDGLGYRITKTNFEGTVQNQESCDKCKRRGWTEGW